MDPREALSHIEQIREQLARVETFRAFRAASVALTGMLALAAALIQREWQLADPDRFLALWVVVAAAAMIIVVIEMTLRYRAADSVLQRDALILAARQFVPSVVAGALLTLAIYRFGHDAVRLLPGLWAIVFSLGVFASRPGLPRAINFAGAYYLMIGLLIIATTGQTAEFELWPMPVAFGGGQFVTATILYLYGERPHE